MARIVMAMSGGVDSSVAAALLCRAGHEVIGVFMRHGEAEPASCQESGVRSQGSGVRSQVSSSPLHPFTPSPVPSVSTSRVQSAAAALPIVRERLDHKQGCCSASDAEDARRVAQNLAVPFYALNLSDDFGRIIDYFVAEYRAARTPNPCVMCNNWLKFGKLFDYADSVGAEFVATGHYARLASADSSSTRFSRVARDALLRGIDSSKDQSYVLFGVARECLPRMMLPIGAHRKEEIRQLARELDLRVADKPDSQEICFVASGDHAEFVRRRSRGDDAAEADCGGEIALADGTVVGQHAGIEAFTIGQRKGLRVAMGEPFYVTHIDADSRRVTIGRREELARRELTADRANWLIDPPQAPFRAQVQIRYNSTAAPATVEPDGDDRFRVRFDEPRYGVAPGQAAVCYDGDRVLGGGWIG